MVEKMEIFAGQAAPCPTISGSLSSTMAHLSCTFCLSCSYLASNAETWLSRNSNQMIDKKHSSVDRIRSHNISASHQHLDVG